MSCTRRSAPARTSFDGRIKSDSLPDPAPVRHCSPSAQSRGIGSRAMRCLASAGARALVVSLALSPACGSKHDAGSDAPPPPPPDAAIVPTFGHGGTWAFDEGKGATASGDALHGAPAWTVGKIGT